SRSRARSSLSCRRRSSISASRCPSVSLANCCRRMRSFSSKQFLPDEPAFRTLLVGGNAAFGVKHRESGTLLGSLTLHGEQLRTQVQHAHAVAERERLPQHVWLWQIARHFTD